jgi:hypothetical protein
VAKPNYQYEKRARELAKKQKKEEKLKHKKEMAAKAAEAPEGGEVPTEGETSDASPEGKPEGV